MDSRPIGMFDSGIGGLTVLKEYMKIMPNENYIYYADTKHLPYGNKSKDEIISYAENIVNYLISKNVKAIIIACGTASSLAYDYLNAKYDIPIFDIITPVVQCITSKNIGIIATQGSINSGVWKKRLLENNLDRVVKSVACPKLVSLAEKGLANSLIAKYYIKKYIKPFKNSPIDSLILGCTHYPLFEKAIKNELGNNVNLINIGTLSAKSFNEYCNNNSFSTSSSSDGCVTYVASSDEDAFLKKVKKIVH